MEAVRSSNMSVNFYQTVLCHIAEDGTLQCKWNLHIYIVINSETQNISLDRISQNYLEEMLVVQIYDCTRT
jgi:hypothetical protein